MLAHSARVSAGDVALPASCVWVSISILHLCSSLCHRASPSLWMQTEQQSPRNKVGREGRAQVPFPPRPRKRVLGTGHREAQGLHRGPRAGGWKAGTTGRPLPPATPRQPLHVPPLCSRAGDSSTWETAASPAPEALCRAPSAERVARGLQLARWLQWPRQCQDSKSEKDRRTQESTAALGTLVHRRSHSEHGHGGQPRGGHSPMMD